MTTIKLLQGEKHSKASNILFYVITLVLILAYLAIQPASISIDQMQTIADRNDARVVVYLVSFLIMLLCALTPLPAELVALTNAVIFSPVEAFFVTWFSAVFSAQLGYEFGRLSGLDPCDYNEGGKIYRWLNAYGYRALVIMRLIPVVPFFALNICGGVFKLDRSKYTLITVFTIIPAITLLTFFPQLFI